MEVDGNPLVEGKFYLWKLPRQTIQAKDLHSVFFVTKDNKFYEVAFAKPTDANPVPGWYLVEKEMKKGDAIPEAELVESIETAEDGSTLSIAVGDELKLGEQLS